jgi:hypothetical protein
MRWLGPGAGRRWRGAVLDDINMARAIRAAGGRRASPTVPRSQHVGCTRVDGTYGRGYRKSLWAAFGSPAGALAVAAALAVVYVLPAGRCGDRLADSARWATRPPSSAGLSATRWGGRRVDALAHPLSVAALLASAGVVLGGRARARCSWKGRPV